MAFLFGCLVGYLVHKYQGAIWKYIKDRFDNDGGGPPAFV